MTIRDLWDDYYRRCVIPGCETPTELALQKLGFICGVIATLGHLADGVGVEPGEYGSLLDEATGDLRMHIDRQRRDSN